MTRSYARTCKDLLGYFSSKVGMLICHTATDLRGELGPGNGRSSPEPAPESAWPSPRNWLPAEQTSSSLPGAGIVSTPSLNVCPQPGECKQKSFPPTSPIPLPRKEYSPSPKEKESQWICSSTMPALASTANFHPLTNSVFSIWSR